jgi:integrase
VLLATLDRAVRAGHVSTNVARQVEDRPTAPPRSGKPSGVIVDRAQLEAIVSRIHHADGRALFRFLFASGLRLGEALALRWADIVETVDDEGARAGEVYVSRSQSRVGPNEFALSTTKSGRARHVYVSGEALDEVLGLRGEGEHEGDLVWKRPRGAYAHQWGDARLVASTLGEAPAGVRIHDLRHSRATYLLLRAEAPAHLVSEALGHASVAFTLGTYGHSTGSARRGLANA